MYFISHCNLACSLMPSFIISSGHLPKAIPGSSVALGSYTVHDLVPKLSNLVVNMVVWSSFKGEKITLFFSDLLPYSTFFRFQIWHVMVENLISLGCFLFSSSLFAVPFFLAGFQISLISIQDLYS
ncbi:Hypothetical predicted protein [Octopus vulgaris]|uniref:Uncharacterized protein n=1 Tax=Octopus vulgaris TaxID=6645 RepID=A0AA36FJT9_OCTVU|nr:Hypothetical predicted protein [Octopus vulgaris]